MSVLPPKQFEYGGEPQLPLHDRYIESLRKNAELKRRIDELEHANACLRKTLEKLQAGGAS